MGAEPWSCSVPYQDDPLAALEAARAQEFAAGRYRMDDEDDPPATIEEACEKAAESGTCSVLDMIGVVDTPHDPGAQSPNFGMVAPLSAEQRTALFGTDKPTRSMIDASAGLFELLDRGLGVYVVAHDDGGRPSEIVFAGYSFD